MSKKNNSINDKSGFFSLFASTIASVAQKIFLMIMRMIGKEKEGMLTLQKNDATTNQAKGLPGSVWVFGCSAGAAGEIAAFYDQEEYPNIYDGPTNGGVMPLDENPWPVFADSSATDPSPEGDDVKGIYHSNPLVASMKGVNRRTDFGSIDDYWGDYNSSNENDPYTGSSEGGAVPL
jgi:hypothetical protein